MKQFAPACERNQSHILEVLKRIFARSGDVLEIGSGTGQHAVYFAAHLRHLRWQPTDLAENLPSIDAWRRETESPNVLEPRVLDLAASGELPVNPDYIVCINTIHIVSWPRVKSLFELAGRSLGRGGILYCYGPFRYAERDLEPSNEQFDQILRSRDSGSGIRLFEDVNRLAGRHGFVHEGDQAMPANNRSMWWKRN